MSFTEAERKLRKRDSSARYYESHKDEVKKSVKEYKRKSVIHTSGGRVIIAKKRDYPKGGACEVCGRVTKRYLHYHHWDGDVPAFGLWLCGRCHIAAEAFEQGFAGKYEQLKQVASREAALSNMPDVVKDMIGVGG